MSTRCAVVLAVGLVLAALAHGGVYAIVIAGSGGGGEGISGDIAAYRVNKFTGEVATCRSDACVPVRWPRQR